MFGWIGLTSLGGGRSVYFHAGLVEKRKWITNHEFIQDLTLSQLLPGPNYSNLAVAIGVRLAGWRGGELLVAGAIFLLVGPFHVHTVLAVLLVAPLSLWIHRPPRSSK